MWQFSSKLTRFFAVNPSRDQNDDYTNVEIHPDPADQNCRGICEESSHGAAEGNPAGGSPDEADEGPGAKE
jgi:hypothetical protein